MLFSLCVSILIVFELSSMQLEVHQRLMACKERCNRYKLNQSITNAARQSFNYQQQGSPQSPHGHLNSHQSVFSANTQGFMDDNMYNQYMSLQEEVEVLRSELEVADEDIAELEAEVLENIQGKDKSPAALLFFTLLHDPTYIQNLQQLMIQLNQLKPFADGNMAHIDFMTLRKRIQVCIICIPGLDKMISYYSNLYNKWSQFRNNWFASRNVTGGAADCLSSCPLCYQGFHGNTNNHDSMSKGPRPSRQERSKEKRRNAPRPIQQQQQQPQQQMRHSQSHVITLPSIG